MHVGKRFTKACRSISANKDLGTRIHREDAVTLEPALNARPFTLPACGGRTMRSDLKYTNASSGDWRTSVISDLVSCWCAGSWHKIWYHQCSYGLRAGQHNFFTQDVAICCLVCFLSSHAASTAADILVEVCDTFYSSSFLFGACEPQRSSRSLQSREISASMPFVCFDQSQFLSWSDDWWEATLGRRRMDHSSKLIPAFK